MLLKDTRRNFIILALIAFGVLAALVKFMHPHEEAHSAIGIPPKQIADTGGVYTDMAPFYRSLREENSDAMTTLAPPEMQRKE